MARSKISFTLGAGSSPGAITNNDLISGFQFYGTAPGSFATTACQAVFSLQDAYDKGITNLHVGETAAKAIYTVSGSVTLGDTFAMTVTEPNPNGTSTAVDLGTATVATAATATGAATDIAAKINAGTYLHGYSATSALGVVTITAKSGLGVALNTGTPLAVVVTGTSTGTITQQFGTGSGGATTGVASRCDVWYYHISEFFGMQPNGKLWVQILASVNNSADIITLQTAADGECRRIGVFDVTAKTAAQVTTQLGLLQAQADTLFAAYQPTAIMLAPNIKAISDLSTLDNLQSTATAKSCYCVISQDGAADGAQLYVNSGFSVSNIGCILGTSSLADVSQDIGEVGAFNISNGSENNIPAFTNGTLVSAVSSSLLDTLDSYRYGFCVKYTGYPGTYINNDWTAIVSTSDYNRLSRILTIYKVEREQYIALLPLLKSRIYLNADGTMTTVTLNQYFSAAEPSITTMVRDGDLSPGNLTGTSLTTGVVQISPTQDVQSQGYIAITYNLLAVNIADNINVTLQFTQKL